MNALVDELFEKPPYPKIAFVQTDNFMSDSYANDCSNELVTAHINLRSEPLVKSQKDKRNLSKKTEKDKETSTKAPIEFGVEYSHEFVPEPIPALKGYKYAISYLPSMGPRRRKRRIHCKQNG